METRIDEYKKKELKMVSCCQNDDSLRNELFIQNTSVTRYQIILDKIREKDSTIVDEAYKNIE